jgi:hypothetical protein
MYRAEFDVRQLVVDGSVPDLLMLCLRQIGQHERIVVGVHAGPEVELGSEFVLTGGSKRTTFFSMVGEISLNALRILTNLPYGEVLFLGLANDADLLSHRAALTDLDGALATLGVQTHWAIGYDNEAAVVTLLARTRSVVKGQVLSILEMSLDSLQ